MNTEYLFKLFNESIDSKSDKEIEKEIMQSAHYNLKAFIRYITNLKNFELKLLMIAKRAESDRDVTDEKAKAEYLGFNKAFFHISEVSLHEKGHILDMDLINPLDLSYCLQLTKSYFLSISDYDKVAFLKEMQEFVEKRYENLELEE